MHDQLSRNRRRAAALVVAHVAVVTVVVGGLLALAGGGLWGLVAGAVVAGASAAAAYRWSDVVVLRTCGAVPADPTERARLHNLVDGLCIAGGLPKPRVWVIDDPAPNAFATGRSPKHASVVVTSGLLDALDRVELEAVLAHLLSHVRSDDVSVATLAVTLVAWPVLVVDLLVRRRSGGGDGAGPGALGGALLGASASVARVLEPVVDGERIAAADLAALAMTRYPPGLIGALEKLQADRTAVRGGLRATAHLWVAAPLAGRDGGGRRADGDRRFAIHPPTEDRLAVLREL